MKTILALLLLCAPLQAQEQVPLTQLVWMPDASFLNSATYDDNECGEMIAGYVNKYWYVAYELPDHREPDSVTFVLSANCEFVMFSGWSHNNQLVLGYGKNRSGEFTVPYKMYRRAYCVGVGLSDQTHDGDLQRGTVCVNAAYAWYHTAGVDLTQRLIETQQVNWYGPESINDPAPKFYGTYNELLHSGLHGMFFSINGKYLILE